MIRVAVLGAAGRMGQAIIRAARRMPDIQLVGAVESVSCPQLGKDSGTIAGIDENSIVISSDIRGAMAKAEVLIDFTMHTATVEHVRLAAEMDKALVIGTTGLNPDETEVVHRACSRIPVVWAPNMSLGVNLLFALVAKTARVLDGYDIEIIETHHRHKKDAPSGTALRLAEVAGSARNLDTGKATVCGRQGMTGERPSTQIGIHSVRAGDVVGDHTVVFATEGERIELCHRASNRDCLALGALHAAAWIHGRAHGLYTMQDVLGLSE